MGTVRPVEHRPRRRSHHADAGPAAGHATASPVSAVVLLPCRLATRDPAPKSPWWRTITVGTAAGYPVGAPTITLPSASPTTHKLIDGHETTFKVFVPSTRVCRHASAVPVGDVEATTSPKSLPLATQNAGEGHAIVLVPRPACTPGAVQADLPPDGTIDVRIMPLSTTTHINTDEHETPAVPGSAGTR